MFLARQHYNRMRKTILEYSLEIKEKNQDIVRLRDEIEDATAEANRRAGVVLSATLAEKDKEIASLKQGVADYRATLEVTYNELEAAKKEADGRIKYDPRNWQRVTTVSALQKDEAVNVVNVAAPSTGWIQGIDFGEAEARVVAHGLCEAHRSAQSEIEGLQHQIRGLQHKNQEIGSKLDYYRGHYKRLASKLRYREKVQIKTIRRQRDEIKALTYDVDTWKCRAKVGTEAVAVWKRKYQYMERKALAFSASHSSEAFNEMVATALADFSDPTVGGHHD